MKKQMKKILCVVLSILMTFSYAVPAFAGSIDNTHLSTKQSDVKSDAEVKAVEKKIDAIGKVYYTDKSLAKIIVAENAYNALSDMQKSNISNYGALKAARNAYDALAADNIDTSSYTITDKGSLSDDVNWFVYDNGLLEITGEGSIPSYSKGNAPWYQYKDNLTAILVRSSITSIGDSAFYGCNNVTDITLPFVGESRTATGYKATFGYVFGYTTYNAAQKELRTPGNNYLYEVYTATGDVYSSAYCYNSNISIRYCYTQSDAFANYYVKTNENPWYSCYDYYTDSYCHYGSTHDETYNLQTYSYYVPTKLTTVNITNANKIETAAFNNCKNITKITLNDGVTSIGDYAFRQCTALQDYVIPKTVSNIGAYLHYGDTELTEVYIPDVVKEIKEYSFFGCTNISKLQISKYAESIGSYAFYGLNSLPAISIPNNVKTIGAYAFYDCDSATSLHIPDSVKTIGSYAFSDCSRIAELTIPDSVTEIGSYAFSDCSSIKVLSIESGVKKISEYSFENCAGLTTITVPNTVETIEAFAFNGCNNVTDITLPFVGKSRDATEYEATFGYIFGYDVKTSSVGEATNYETCDDKVKLYQNNGKVLYKNITVSRTKKLTTDYIDGSINEEYGNNYSWYSCQNGMYTHSVSTTSSTSFTNYSKMEQEYDKYQKKTYYTYYWDWYNQIQTYYFKIPNTLTTVNITDADKIETAAFNNCKNITKITLNDGVTSVGDYAFQQCTALKDYAIPETVSKIGSYAYYGDTALTEMYIPDAVTKINEYAFYGCSKISRLKISKYAESIGSYAFYGLNSLPAISISNNVKEIGSHAFEACSSATALYLPDSVTTIGNYAFSNCSIIAEIAIPDSVTKMGAYAFSGCSSVEKLSIGSGVKAIEKYTFQNCTGLTTITVPNTVETIEAFAFNGCNNVTDITLPFVGKSRDATEYEAIFGYIFGYDVKTSSVGEATNYETCDDKVKLYQNNGKVLYKNITVSRTKKLTTDYIDGSINEEYGNNYSWYSCQNGMYTHSVSTTSSTSFTNYSKMEQEYDKYQKKTYYTYYWDWYNQIQTYYFKIPNTLTTVNITDADKIETAAFNNCKNITKITLNDGVTSIGDYAFQSNPWYDNLTDEFETVGDNVLIKYNGTKSSVTIPDTVKHIAGGVFKNNSKISEVILPNELLSIGDNALYGTALSTVTIPRSVTKIGTNAFPSCNLKVYQPSAGYDYNSSNKTVLNDSYTKGNDTFYYIIKSDDTAEIIGCKTTSTELTVPEEIDGHTVSSIGDYGFAKCSTLKSITIPKNIKTIGKYAFDGCTGLINATIPTTVSSVGDYAFNNCAGLKNVTISEGVESIGKGCFYNCTSLAEAVVPDTAKYVGAYAFYNCTSMVNATIGTTTESIGEYTFYNCEKLETVVIGYSVKSIGNHAFYNCGLSKVTIPSSTQYIGKYAFANNKSMTKVTHKKGINTIDEFAYQNCTSLETVTLPTSLEIISKGVFRNCSLLKTANLPSSLKELGSYAFDNCSSLPTVTIPTGVTVINDCTFNKCTSLATVTINSNVTSIGFDAFRDCAFSAITLPNTVETIKGGAFRGCAKLTKIIIPDATNTIGEAAFFDCTELSEISVADSLEYLGDSALKNNNNLTAKIRYLSGTVTDSLFEKQGISHAVLDENIFKIGNSVFAYCDKLNDITYGDKKAADGEFLFSDKVVSLGNEIFKDASLLKNLIIPDTIETIGTNAFYNSVAGGYRTQNVTVTFYYVGGNIAADILKEQKISHIVVNDNIKSLGNDAFNSITTLETVSLPDTVTTCGDNVFAESSGNVTTYFRGVDGTVDKDVYKAKLSGLTYLVFDKNIKTIDSYSFANTSTVKGVIIHNTDMIKDHAFADSTSINGVVIENAGSIGEYAFSNSSAMNYIEIGKVNLIGNYAFSDSSTNKIELDDIDTIDDYAFSNCPAMKQLYIDSVVNINDYAFYNDIAIDDIVINQNLVNIGSHAFDSCKLIPKVKLPNTVRNIGAYAFYDCNSMKSINIPVGVDKVNEYTFFGCASLLSVDLPNTVKSIGDYAYYGCVLVNDLSLGNAVETIGSYAFYNCNKVKEIILPDLLKSIGNYAFRSCSSITEITIPDSVTQLGDCVFYACTGLEKAEFGTGIVKIGNSEFYGCVKFTELYLYGNVNNIHDLAFYGAEDAEVYTYPNSYVEDYCNDNGLVYHEIGNITSVSLTPPAKTEYVENDKLDTAGMKFNVTYDNGYERTVTSGLKITGFNSENVGKQTVTVSYRGKSATFEVNVSEKKVVDAEFEFPNDIKIIQGEDLDLSSGKVILTYSDGSQQTIKKGYTVTGFDKTKVGKQNVTITYRDFSTDLEVTVEEKQEPEHTHNWSAWKYNNDAVYNSSSDYKDGTQTRTCSSCGESETKEAPNTALLRRRGNALSLESSITLATYITKDVVDYYDEVYAEFTRNGKTEKVYPSGKTLTSNSIVYCIFDYTGLSPQALGDDVSITFYGVKDSVTYNGNAYKYSATDYIKSTLNKPTSSAKLKTLLVDLVYYGEACQIYQNYKTDNLLTDILTDEQKSLRSTADLNLTNIKNVSYETCENRLVKFGTALRLNNSVEIAIPLNMTNVTLDDLSFKVKIGSRTLTYTYAENPDNFEKGKDGYWYFYFDGVYANQMSDEVFITAYKGDEQVSYTLKYSVESYAATVTDAKLKAVTDAMMRYGNSAKAYAGK